MGGKTRSNEEYMADKSPLKKTRGAVFMCLKQDYTKTLCAIVSTEFCIYLSDENTVNHAESTVFGYVSEGLAVCDALSHLGPKKDHIAVVKAGLIRT